MMKKKMISMVLILTMATGLMTGCGSNEAGETGQKETGTADTTENKTVTMASNPFVGLAPFYVAMDKGFFEDCGLDFSMVDFDDSSASCSALLAGKVDLAYTTLDAAIIAESQYDEDMLDVTAIVDESAGADGILVKKDINSIADLKGKKVGVSINQTSHYLLMQALETAGLTDADVDLVNMTSSDAGVSFISGDLDAAVTWEPYLSNAVEQGVGKLIFSSKDAPGSIVDVLAVGTDNKDAAWLAQVNEAYEKGLDYLNDDRTHEEAVEIVAKHLEVSADEADSMISTIKLYSPEDSSAELKDEGLVYQQSGRFPVSILIKELLRSQWNRHNYWQKNNSRIRLLLTDIVV